MAKSRKAGLRPKERRRLAVLELVREGSLGKAEAARRLGLSRVYIYRLLARLEEEGPSGLLSRRVGKPPNSAYGDDVREAVRALCADPALAGSPLALISELVESRIGVRVSPQTLGRWHMEWGLPPTKRRSRRRDRRPRKRGSV